MLIRLSLTLILAVLPTFVFAIQFDPPLDDGIEFPETIVDETSTVEFTVSEPNDVDPVTVRITGIQPDEFTVEPAQQVLRGGEQVVFRVSFTPDENGEIEGELTGAVFGADGNQQMAFATDLIGVGVNAENPVIEVRPRELSLEIEQRGDGDQAAVDVGNGGEGDLDFEVEVAEMSAWIEVEPRAGHIDGNSDEMIQLTFSTTDVVPDSGEHDTEVLIISNDPENEEVIVHVSLLVSYQPVARITVAGEDVIELSITEFDHRPQETLTIMSAGERVLVYEIAVPEIPWIDVNPLAGELEPGNEQVVTIEGIHSGLPNDVYEAQIFINSNDPVFDEMEVNVRLVVNIDDNIPRITLSTDTISLEILEPEQQAIDTLIIGNSGTQSLAFIVMLPLHYTWFGVEPVSGTVDPESQVNLYVMTNDTLPANGVYYDVFGISSNDPDNAELVIAVNLVVDIQDIEAPSNSELPSAYRLSTPFPNPFNSETVISYALPRASEISMKVYDLSGRELESILDGMTSAGYHTLRWNAGELPTGIYLIRMEAGEFRAVRKVMLIR